jgi:hypothetical protein
MYYVIITWITLKTSHKRDRNNTRLKNGEKNRRVKFVSTLKKKKGGTEKIEECPAG